jgi:hypothetical protein
MPEKKKEEPKTSDEVRVEKSAETAATVEKTEATVAIETLWKTSDGELFYKKTFALLHAKSLDDKTVTETTA